MNGERDETSRVDDSVLRFYEELASDYHLIFADWRDAVRWQGEVLDGLIRAHVGAPVSILDCACGIGTQAIGLALRGHLVHGTDLSPEAIARAEREAASFGVAPTFAVADLRRLDSAVAGTFDVVLACDNALAHMLTADDLRQAFRAMRAKLRPGGLLLVSTRDYDEVLAERPAATFPRRFADPDGERVSFQLWDWADDGLTYTQRLLFLREDAGRWDAAAYQTVARAIRRDEARELLDDAGCEAIRWHLPDETGYYQPIVTARAGAG